VFSGLTFDFSVSCRAAAPVIVFLKSQPTAPGGARDRSGQRLALAQAAQAPYFDQLEQLGAADVHRYGLEDAIAAPDTAASVAKTPPVG
jgi:hypothetical protein